MATNEPSTSSNSTSVVQFTDPPLTDLTVTVASEVTGGTASNITCTDASSNDIANSPQPPDVNGSTQYAASATNAPSRREGRATASLATPFTAIRR